MRKHLLTAALSCLTALLLSVPAFAGMWTVDDQGIWHYDYYGRGTQEGYLRSQWAWIDGNYDGISQCYYFDEAGNMLSNTVTPDGSTVNEAGQWTVDGVVQERSATADASAAESETPAVDLLHTDAEESAYVTPFETAVTASGLTWEDGLRFSGGIDHLAHVVYNLGKNYETMTITFSPESGQQDVTTEGRINVTGLSTGRSIFSSGKMDASHPPVSVSFSIKHESGVRISVVRGYEVLFQTIEVR